MRAKLEYTGRRPLTNNTLDNTGVWQYVQPVKEFVWARRMPLTRVSVIDFQALTL